MTLLILFGLVTAGCLVGCGWLAVLLVRLQAQVRTLAEATQAACNAAGEALGRELPTVDETLLHTHEPEPPEDVFSQVVGLGAWVPLREPVKR